MSEPDKAKAKRTQTRLPKLPDGYHYEVRLTNGAMAVEIEPLLSDGKWRAHTILPPGDHHGGRDRYADHDTLPTALHAAIDGIRKYETHEAKRREVEKSGEGLFDAFGEPPAHDEVGLGEPSRMVNVKPDE